MRSRVMLIFAQVMGAADFLSVADKHRPNGNFALCRGKAGFLERKAHPNFVVLHNSSFIHAWFFLVAWRERENPPMKDFALPLSNPFFALKFFGQEVS